MTTQSDVERPKTPDPAPVPLETVDPVATAATEVIGGPLGRLATLSRRGWAGAASFLIAMSSVVVALGVLQKSHCIQHGWTAPSFYWRTCFSDLPVLFTAPPLATGQVPYLGGVQMEEPLLNGLAMWLIAKVTPGTGHGAQVWYFGIWALVVALLVALAVAALAWARPRHAWRASHLALSPVLVFAALLSPDMLGVCLVSLGIACWYRGRLGLAGLAFGFSLLTGVYPVVVVIGLLLVAIRAGRAADGTTVLSAAVLTAVAAALPVMVLGPRGDLGNLGLRAGNAFPALRIWRDAGTGYGSTWKAVAVAWHDISATHLTLIGWLGLVWAILIGALVAFGFRREVGLGPVVLSMIAVMMLTGKSLPVQQAIWLLPLIVISAVPWRDHLVWAAAEAVHFVAVWMFIPSATTPDKALDASWYAAAVVVRLAGVLYLLWSAIHHAPDESLAPPEDVPAEDDPHARLLDAAPREFGTA